MTFFVDISALAGNSRIPAKNGLRSSAALLPKRLTFGLSEIK
jgi:hypothetical protein